MQKENEAIAIIIIGGFGAKSSVAGRVRFALYTTSSAQVDITGTQKEELELAQKDFEGQAGELDDIFKNKLPALEKEFEDAGGVLFNTPPTRRRFFDN